MNKYVEMLNWHIFKLHQALFWEKNHTFIRKLIHLYVQFMIVFPLEDAFYIATEYDDLNCLFGSLVCFFLLIDVRIFIIIKSIFIIRCILGMFWEMTAFTNMYNLIYQILYKYTMFTDVLSIIFCIFVCYWKLIC